MLSMQEEDKLPQQSNTSLCAGGDTTGPAGTSGEAHFLLSQGLRGKGLNPSWHCLCCTFCSSHAHTAPPRPCSHTPAHPHSHPRPMAAARTGGLGLAGLPRGNSTSVSARRADGIHAELPFPVVPQQPRELRNRRLLTTHTVKNSLQRKIFFHVLV